MAKEDISSDFGLKKFIVPVIGIALLVVLILIFGKPSNGGKILSASDVAKKATDYINTNLKPAELSALSATSTKEVSGVYEFKLEADKQEKGTVYATKDGKYLFVQYINLDEKPENAPETAQSETKPVTKSDKPDVKVFVMSYCPFGLQAQKMYIPAYNLLKDKANMEIMFVDYLMHGEKELVGNINEYCIQKEQGDKFIKYLSCFTTSGDHSKCVKDAGVDATKLKSCYEATDKQFNLTADFKASKDQFPKFALHSDLCKQYNVLGSPTIVINGAEADVSPRSPEQFKKVICDAFNTKPSECDTKLSETAASSGIGNAEGDNSAPSSGCGQ